MRFVIALLLMAVLNVQHASSQWYPRGPQTGLTFEDVKGRHCRLVFEDFYDDFKVINNEDKFCTCDHWFYIGTFGTTLKMYSPDGLKYIMGHYGIKSDVCKKGTAVDIPSNGNIWQFHRAPNTGAGLGIEIRGEGTPKTVSTYRR